MNGKNNKFSNGLWKAAPILILVTGGFFASNRIDTATAELKKCLDRKVDKNLYDQETKTRDEQYERIIRSLERIESRFNGRVNANSDGFEISGS